MGRVSKKPLNKDIEKEIEEHLSFIISSLTKKDEIEGFLKEFLTKEEKTMLGKRIVLYMLLYRGISSLHIHNTLSMSHETIHWYRQIYENKSDIFKKTIHKLIGREKTKELWRKIEKILEPVSLALEAKTNMKARAKLASGDFWKDE